MLYIKRLIAVEAHTFREFVQYGRDSGAAIVNGMPWHFVYKGYPVTHEHDQCYLILRTNAHTLHFTPDDMIYIKDGTICIISAQMFHSLYEPVSTDHLSKK